MKILGYLALTLAMSAPLATAAADNTADLEAQAKSLVQSFAGRLKPQLQQAMQAGGPVNAIGVCAEQAPAIAAQLSKESGWMIKRVSLKPRNATSAVPDAWETQVLESFAKRLAAGEAQAQLVYFSKENGEFRYMQAQIVEPLCLNCHAKKEQLAPAVREALQKHYPEDKATGYSAGDIRGAFSLRYQL